jgi:1,4-dihydroxy-2-naphthoyl-CoA synthase
MQGNEERFGGAPVLTPTGGNVSTSPLDGLAQLGGHDLVVDLPPLVRQVGRKAAFELIMTGRAISPDEALRMGMINRVVSGDALMEEALARGTTFAGYSPDALAGMKKILYAVADVPVADGIAYVDELKK